MVDSILDCVAPMTRPTLELPPLEIYMLGLVDFVEVQQLQRRIVYDLGEREGRP